MATTVTSYLREFQESRPWPLDDFQIEAIEKLDTHNGVLVSAPTSSGKTVVAEYAIFRALAEDVQVARGVPRADVGQEPRRVCLALPGEELRLGDDLVLLRRRLWVGVLRDKGIHLRVVEAGDRRALADAARVEADHVVLRQQRWVEHL